MTAATPAGPGENEPGGTQPGDTEPDGTKPGGTGQSGTELGGTVLGGTPAEFGKIIADATEKWARVIKLAGIKAE